MDKFWKIILFIFLSHLAMGQESLLIHKVDSIEISYRSEGVQLDSVDAINIGTINLRPAAGFAQIHEFNLAQNLFHSPALFTYLPNDKRIGVVRSPLPYLGFQYAFGEAMNQAVDVRYHHFITDSTHIHLRYHRRTSNGVIRQSDFTLNDVHLLLHHHKNRWRTMLDAYYAGYNYTENGGIISTDVLETQGIDFLPVRKTNAESIVRKVDIDWVNYLDMYRDSVLAHGFKARSHYEIVSREYIELPADTAMENIFIDSNRTRDQFQTPCISTGGGYFFSSKILEVDGTLNHRYWRNQNLGRYRDTTEIFLHSNLRFGFGRFVARNEFYLNTLGALGEFYNHSSVYFKPIKDIEIRGQLNFDNRLPLPYQRFHFSNHYEWELEELNTQQLLNINGRISYGRENKAFAQLDWTNITNGLYFIDGNWTQDELGLVSVGALQLGGEYHTEKWHFYPTATVRFHTDNFAYQPTFSTRTRIAYKKGFFKGESLILALGVDLGYDSEYNHLTYNPIINVLEPSPLGSKTSDLFRINGFVNGQIDQLRFFIRAENIDYFINDPTTRMDANYVIMPFIIRVGITWDFYN